MDPVRAERLEPLDERLAMEVEALVDVLQPFRRHRLYPDERALDVRALHRSHELRVLGRFHRDLGEEHHVFGQALQPLHQREALGADAFELAEPRRISAAAGLRQIGERHGIEIVVGERDEAEALAPQRDDLADHGLDVGLARLLAVGAPHRAERAVLRAAPHRLHRRPHVAILRQQVPSRLAEVIAGDAPRLVHALLHARDAIVDHRPERVIAVAPDDRVRPAEIVRFVRKERRVDAAEYDLGPALAHGAPDLVPAQRVPRVDADADDVAWLHLLRVENLQRLVADHRIAETRRRGGRKHVQPARRDDGGAERDVAWVHEKDAHSELSRVRVDRGDDACVEHFRNCRRSPGRRA